jgi:hypothetical protein
MHAVIDFFVTLLECEVCHRMYCVESQKNNPYAFLAWFVWHDRQLAAK